MRVFPFANVKVMKESDEGIPEPTIWVCNHTSMLDIFVLLAADKKLRGKKKRPIKIIYWKELEREGENRLWLERQKTYTKMSCRHSMLLAIV